MIVGRMIVGALHATRLQSCAYNLTIQSYPYNHAIQSFSLPHAPCPMHFTLTFIHFLCFIIVIFEG